MTSRIRFWSSLTGKVRKLEKQKTIGGSVCLSGKALQTGSDVEFSLSPASQDTGITFKRLDLPDEPPLRVDGAVFCGDHARRTSIGQGPAAVQTVEHFLAALWGAGIDNILVEIRGEELPALDGSAKGFLDLIKSAGIVEQESHRRIIKITEPLEMEENGASLSVFPDENFNISYLIEYDVPSIGRETFNIAPDRISFEKEIAPARTFCLKKEAEALLKAGFGLGATCENTLVMDDTGPVGTTLRFPDEPVRHKILDLIGDLYMLGMPIIGRVVAERSGHRMNARMVKEIYEKYVSKGL